MKTIFDLQTGVVTLLCTAALAGLTACEADPVMQESGKLPDKGSIEEGILKLLLNCCAAAIPWKIGSMCC